MKTYHVAIILCAFSACIAIGGFVMHRGGWSSVVYRPGPPPATNPPLTSWSTAISNAEPLDTNSLWRMDENKKFYKVSGIQFTDLSIEQDWVMGSPSAVSNAMYFGVPAPGYSVGWATNHTFAPMRGGQPLTYNSMVRRSYWQALVATWRDYEVLAGLQAEAIK